MLEFEGRAVSEGLLAETITVCAASGLTPVWDRLQHGYMEATPSGGIHLLYRLTGMLVPPNTKLARRLARDEEITDDERIRMAGYAARGIDFTPVRVLMETRGEGGFVIVAPSRGPVHPSGKPWQLLGGTPGSIPVITAAERNALHAVIRSLDQMPQPEPASFQQPASGHQPDSGLQPGEDYSQRTDWAQILVGWQLIATRGTVRYWRRPGKEDGMSATTGRPPYDNLYVFSTSTEFETGKPISKFGAYALMHHGGDFRAAAAQLRREGFGEPGPSQERAAPPKTAAGLDDFRPARSKAMTTKEERRPSGPPVPSADPAMYTGILGDIVAAAAPTTEADPVGIYASLLAGAGVIMNATPYVQVGNTRHPLLIWPLLLGRTGSGRKGEATSTAEIFLRGAAAEAQGFMVSGLSSGEGLIERIRDPDDDKENKFSQPGGTADKRLIVLETEFASVLARAKREGSTLAAVQRQAWEGRALSVLNRKQLRASASHIAIIGHVTPQEFKLRLAEADMTGGTYNRYLPLFVERPAAADP